MTFVGISVTSMGSQNNRKLELKKHMIIRNFSGEDFDEAFFWLGDSQQFQETIAHEETRQLLTESLSNVPIRKMWKWDSQNQPWDPEKIAHNVGIPVQYRLTNSKESKFLILHVAPVHSC